MHTEFAEKNGFCIIRLKDDISIAVDIKDLLALVDQCLAQGTGKIAISFTKNSYLSSHSISVLLQCYEKARRKSAAFAIISPSKDMMDVLQTIGLEQQFSIYSNENELKNPD